MRVFLPHASSDSVTRLAPLPPFFFTRFFSDKLLPKGGGSPGIGTVVTEDSKSWLFCYAAAMGITLTASKVLDV
jgi:hypothetical protein